MRFWSVLWAAFGHQGGVCDTKSGTIWLPFSTKSRKMASKKACKNRCRKSYEIWCQKVRKWCQNGFQNQWFFILFRKRRKRSRPYVFPYKTWFRACKQRWKINVKSMLEKLCKHIVKWCKTWAKMEPKTITNPFKNRCVFQDPPKTTFCAPGTASGRPKVAVLNCLARFWRPPGF